MKACVQNSTGKFILLELFIVVMLFKGNRTCLCTVLVELGRDDDEHGTLKTSIKGNIYIQISGNAK